VVVVTNNGTVHVFCGHREAYDSVHRDLLLQSLQGLRDLGLRGNMPDVVASMY